MRKLRRHPDRVQKELDENRLVWVEHVHIVNTTEPASDAGNAWVMVGWHACCCSAQPVAPAVI
jgi:hypothetical protein